MAKESISSILDTISRLINQRDFKEAYQTGVMAIASLPSGMGWDDGRQRLYHQTALAESLVEGGLDEAIARWRLLLENAEEGSDIYEDTLRDIAMALIRAKDKEKARAKRALADLDAHASSDPNRIAIRFIAHGNFAVLQGERVQADEHYNDGLTKLERLGAGANPQWRCNVAYNAGKNAALLGAQGETPLRDPAAYMTIALGTAEHPNPSEKRRRVAQAVIAAFQGVGGYRAAAEVIKNDDPNL